MLTLRLADDLKARLMQAEMMEVTMASGPMDCLLLKLIEK
jgi:hypothetical protein